MTHPTQDQLLDLALDVLPPTERDEARAHLEECSECAESFASLEEEQAVLVQALGAAPALPDGLQRAVLGAVSKEPRRLAARPFPRLLAIAAALLVVGGLAFVLSQPTETPKQELLRQVRQSELLAMMEE